MIILLLFCAVNPLVLPMGPGQHINLQIPRYQFDLAQSEISWLSLSPTAVHNPSPLRPRKTVGAVSRVQSPNELAPHFFAWLCSHRRRDITRHRFGPGAEEELLHLAGEVLAGT